MKRCGLRFFLVLLGFLSCNLLLALGYFEYSPLARQAYHDIISLRFTSARSKLVRLKLTEPDNLILYNLENYMDCLALFIGEQPDAYNQLKDNKYTRLDAIRNGDRESPYYLYCQADIYLQWAVARVKFEDYFQAVLEIKKAFSLLERNAKKFPEFQPTFKNLGLLHALVGTVPDQYRWGLNLLGMSGTIAQGKAELEQVLTYARQKDFVFHDEVCVMYAYLLLHLENNEVKAWEALQEAKMDTDHNPLACFVMANIAMQSQKNEQAISLLEKRPKGNEYLPFPYLTLMEGIARLNSIDSTADEYLLQFIQETKGIHYIKEAYQKLAWHAILFGQPHLYESYMEACKKSGASVIDEDKTALHEARSGNKPDKDLLAARLLFDGGYFEEAKTSLDSVKFKPEADKSWQLEYHYRRGRIHHALEEYDVALYYYDLTILEGQHEGFYYACNAAILSGNIFEERGAIGRATSSYEQALSMNPDEYQASLHQKAKAGLQRTTQASP